MDLPAYRHKAAHMLNRIYKWIDVKKILTALIIAVSGYAMVVLSNAAEAHEAGLEAHRLLVGNGSPGVIQLLQEIKSDIDEIKTTQKAYELKEFYVYNAMADMGNFGPDTPFVMINELGLARIYKTEEHMRITNVSSMSRESLIFKIQGTFRDENPMTAIKISQRAARMLGVNPASPSIHVEISPITEGVQ